MSGWSTAAEASLLAQSVACRCRCTITCRRGAGGIWITATESHGCTRAFRVKNPTSGAEMLRSCNIAGAPKPTFQPNDWSPASRRLRRVSNCACMPRTTRGSSQSFMIIPGWWALLQGSAARSMRLGIDFVARRLDGAGAHPTPHQHDVFVRGVVETVPAPAR